MRAENGNNLRDRKMRIGNRSFSYFLTLNRTRSQAVARIADRTYCPTVDHSMQNPAVEAAYQI